MFAKGRPQGLGWYGQDPNERPCFLRTAQGLPRGPLEHPGALRGPLGTLVGPPAAVLGTTWA